MSSDLAYLGIAPPQPAELVRTLVDINWTTLADGFVLSYNATTGKYDWVAQSGGGGGGTVATGAEINTGTNNTKFASPLAIANSYIAKKDVNSNLTANNFLAGSATTATAAGTTTLTVASPKLQYFTGTTTQTVKMPVASTLALGQEWVITNQSTGAVTVQSSGGNVITSIAGSVYGNASFSLRLRCIALTGTDQSPWEWYYNGVWVDTNKYLAVYHKISLYGTDGTTVTFPASTSTMARTDAAQTFTGIQTFSSAPSFGALPTGAGVASAATASTLAARDANKNLTANNFNAGVTLNTSDPTLSVSSARIQILQSGASINNVVMPDTTTLALGQQYRIVNMTANGVTVWTSGGVGGNSIFDLPGGYNLAITLICIAQTNLAADWQLQYEGLNVQSNRFLYASARLILTKPTGGTVATMTFPDTSATLARTDAGQTFTGVQTFSSAPSFGVLPTGAGVASAATASTLAARDTNGNLSANNLLEGYATTATAAGTTTLTVSSPYSQFFTGSTTQTVVMPVTSTLVLGQSWMIVNNSSGAVTVNSSGSNAIVTLAASSFTIITCVLTSGTTAASWSYTQAASGGGGGTVATGVEINTGTDNTKFASPLAIANSNLVITDKTQNLTNKTYNKITLTAPATGSTLTIIDGKTLTVNKSFTLDGTDTTTMTFPTTSATIARTDAAQTFTGVQTFSSAPSFSVLPTGAGVASAATASTLAARDANANLTAVNHIEGYSTTATAAGTTTLTVASNYLQYFTGTTTQTVVLPVTSTLVLGQQFLIANLSTGAVTVQSSGANNIIVLPQNAAVLLTCILTSGTTAASWSYSNPTAGSLASATTTIDVSLAAAPTTGQVLTAGGGTTATWVTPSAALGTTQLVDLSGTFAYASLYGFQVSGGITTLPTVGSTYTNNSSTYTIRHVCSWTINGVQNAMLYASKTTGTNDPSGTTLAYATGTGDSSLTIDSWAKNLSSFTFTGGTAAVANAVKGRIFTCQDSGDTATPKRYGYVRDAVNVSGTVSVIVVTNSDLASGDKNFKVTPHAKLEDYTYLITVPGQLTADTSNPQGMWYNTKYPSYVLPFDASVRTVASGGSPSIAVNLYSKASALLSGAVDIYATDTTSNVYAFAQRITSFDGVAANTMLSARITASAGTTPANDLQIKLYVVPQYLFLA